jgi:hypothetical protein
MFIIKNFKNSELFINTKKQFEEINATDIMEAIEHE